ncbi:hypothetical protein WDU94_011827 [Cyamophila willieti]
MLKLFLLKQLFCLHSTIALFHQFISSIFHFSLFLYSVFHSTIALFHLFIFHVSPQLLTYYNPELHISECFSHRHFSSGQQVFIFYGVRRNADFLVHSGFFYPDNEFDGVKILLGISKSDPYYDIRTQLLNRIRISSTSDFILTRTKDCGLEGALLAFLRVFNMTKGKDYTLRVGLR